MEKRTKIHLITFFISLIFIISGTILLILGVSNEAVLTDITKSGITYSGFVSDINAKEKTTEVTYLIDNDEKTYTEGKYIKSINLNQTMTVYEYNGQIKLLELEQLYSKILINYGVIFLSISIFGVIIVFVITEILRKKRRI